MRTEKGRVCIAAHKRGFTAEETRHIFKAFKLPPTVAEVPQKRIFVPGDANFAARSYRDKSDYREITREQANYLIGYLATFFPVIHHQKAPKRRTPLADRASSPFRSLVE